MARSALVPGRPVNALLIYPEIPETFWSFKHALKLIRKKASSPPLGLLTVAAMLPPDWTLRLIDLNVSGLTDDDLAWADCALLSGMTIQRESARRTATQCKAAGLTVIAGGPLFTTEHRDFDNVDHFILNEAEVTLPAFLADLARGEAKPLYESAELADLSRTPTPRWDLVTAGHYASRSIQYSRGCPNNCDFCSVTELFGRRWRTKGTGQIVAELDGLYDLGWRGTVTFVDDNLIGNRRHLRTELLPALIQWRKGKWGMSFSTQVTIDLADDPDLMRLMVRAGFDTVFVGIETLSDASLAECGKTQNRNRDLLNDVRCIQRAGLQVQGGFIVGFDTDTASVFQRLTDFIQKSGIATAMVGLLQAPIGTSLYGRLEREGRIRNRVSGDNVDGSTNIVPTMGLDSLQDGYRKVLQDIYSPPNYYQRLRAFLRVYRPPRSKPRLMRWHVSAFFRSLFYLGIVEKERSQYAGLLLWTLFRKPRALPMAVILAISGYHFRKCSELLAT
jgi:radical SAM superfamily enzyme YgiQ (UPF0313 family)